MASFSPPTVAVYVADTGGNKRHPNPLYKLPASITCYAATKAGKLSKQLFKIKEGSDGMAVDVKGHLYTTHRNAGVRCWRQKLQTIRVPEGPANVCFRR